MERVALGMRWEPERPRILVVACSDGRLQEATDAFLSRALGVRQYDRLYVPGGGGALSASGREFIRASQLRAECRFLVDAHHVDHLVLLFHGPAVDGPRESTCADYRRKQSWANPDQIRAQQEADARDLLSRRYEFAGDAEVSIFRFEVGGDGGLTVKTIHADAPAASPPTIA
jgi:hypothetical protein